MECPGGTGTEYLVTSLVIWFIDLEMIEWAPTFMDRRSDMPKDNETCGGFGPCAPRAKHGLDDWEGN
jgi:hypothetical protein